VVSRKNTKREKEEKGVRCVNDREIYVREIAFLPEPYFSIRIDSGLGTLILGLPLHLPHDLAVSF
jgi:hypothetical protein